MGVQVFDGITKVALHPVDEMTCSLTSYVRV